MKRLLFVISLVVLLFALTTTTVWAAPAAEEATGFDLLGNVIGALGLFAAMMAVLALGTEVVIDTLKYMVGLKQKPTALEALDQLGDQLPGQLSELGVSSEAVTKLTSEMKKALGGLGKGVDIKKALQSEDFDTAIKKAQGWARAVGHEEYDPEEWRRDVVFELGNGIDAFGKRLSIDPSATRLMKQSLAAAAKDFHAEKAAEQVVQSVRGLLPTLTQAWLDGQIGTLAEQGLKGTHAEIMARFDADVAPELQTLGLSVLAVQTIRDQLGRGLERLGDEAIGEVRHLEALRELLQGVEDRRDEIQSPLRKLWRRIARSEFPPGTDLTIGRIFEAVEWGWNYFLGRAPREPVGPLTATTVARRLLEHDNKHQDEEASRLRVLRAISVVVGIYLAFLLQVNAVDLLAGTFDQIAGINTVITTDRVLGWLNPPLLLRLLNRESLISLPEEMELNGGILLSGLAASAGSKFWHDQLARLQAARKAVGEVEKVVETVTEIRSGD
jgi:hypothetical protein